MQAIAVKHPADLIAAASILVVDDDHTMRKVTRSLLMMIGARNIQTATDAMAGLNAIIASPPDVVLLDWEMPGMNGSQFLRALRSPDTFPFPDVPVIMLTSHAERELVIDLVRSGANEYLCKPVSANTLQTRLISVLAKPRAMCRLGRFYGPEPRRPSQPAKRDVPALHHPAFLD